MLCYALRNAKIKSIYCSMLERILKYARKSIEICYTVKYGMLRIDICYMYVKMCYATP